MAPIKLEHHVADQHGPETEDLASYFKRLNFDLNLSPSAHKLSPKPRPATTRPHSRATSVAQPAAPQGVPVRFRYHSPKRLSAAADPFVPSSPTREVPSPTEPFQSTDPADTPQEKFPVDPREEALDDHGKLLLAILRSPRRRGELVQRSPIAEEYLVFRRDSTTSPCRACPYDTATCPCPLRYTSQANPEDLAVNYVNSINASASEYQGPSYNLPISALPQTLRSSSIGATMPAGNNLFGLAGSRYAPRGVYDPLEPVTMGRFPRTSAINNENLPQQSAHPADVQRLQLVQEAEEAERAQLKRETEVRERQRLAKLKLDQEEAERAAQVQADMERREREIEAKRAQLQRESEERQRLAKIRAELEEAERLLKEREEREERERQRVEAERRERLRREQEAKRAAQLKKEQEERERLAQLKKEQEERQRLEEAARRDRLRREEEAKRAAQLKKEQEERERLAKIKAKKEEAERKERERQTLLKVQRNAAISQIKGYAENSGKKYSGLKKQANDKIERQASDISKLDTKIAAKKTEYAQIEQKLKNLGAELKNMAGTKMGMDKDLRQLEHDKSELLSEAQKLQNEAADKIELLKGESLSSEDVAKILEFTKSEIETQAPEAEFSKLSLSDKSECSDDGSESSDEEESAVDSGATPIPAYWKLDDNGPEADRVVKLVNLPTDTTVADIQSLVWGGPLDRIVYTPGSDSAEIYFLVGQDCQKYCKATANHIPYAGDKYHLVRVKKCPPSPRHPFIRFAWEEKITRCIRATGVPEGWSKAELKKYAGSHSRQLEQVVFAKTSTGIRMAEFRFANIHHANAFKFLMKRDIFFYKVKTDYVKDQCAVHHGVHTSLY